MVTASSTSADSSRGVDTATSTPPRGVEQPLVLRVIDAGHHARHPELGLGQQADYEVDLVVAGGRNHDLGVLQADGLQRRDLAGVRLGDRTPSIPGTTAACSRSIR